jgi:hypothetical protein
MIPYNEKIWGVHPREITAAWCSRFVPLPNLEQWWRGAVGAGPPELGYNQTSSIRRRAASRPSRARCRPGCAGGAGTVHTSRPTPSTGAARGRRGRRADAVPALVATLPLPELLKRMRDLPPEVEAQARASLHDAALPQHRRPAPSPRGLALDLRARERVSVLPRERLLVGACPRMAPGGASICVEMADRGPISARRVRDSRRRCRGGRAADAEDVVFAEPKQIEYAYVGVRPPLLRGTRAIFAFLEANGIYPRGRYGAWTTTQWRTACSRRARSRRSSTRSGRRAQAVALSRAAPPVHRHPRLQRGGHPARLVLELQEKLRRFNWSYELCSAERLARSHRRDRQGAEIEHPEVRHAARRAAEQRAWP